MSYHLSTEVCLVSDLRLTKDVCKMCAPLRIIALVNSECSRRRVPLFMVKCVLRLSFLFSPSPFSHQGSRGRFFPLPPNPLLPPGEQGGCCPSSPLPHAHQGSRSKPLQRARANDPSPAPTRRAGDIGTRRRLARTVGRGSAAPIGVLMPKIGDARSGNYQKQSPTTEERS